MNLTGFKRAVRIMSIFIFIALILTITSLCKENDTIVAKEISTEKRVAYMCRPGVAMITNQYTGTLINILENKPTYYLYTQPPTKIELPQFSIQGWGTGFIISSDGYIVTNAHVVHASEEEIKRSFATQAALYMAAQWPSIARSKGLNEQLLSTPEAIKSIIDSLSAFRAQYNQEIKVYYGMPTGSISSPEAHPAEVRKMSPENLWFTYGQDVYRSGKDLAIIKIEGVSNLPTLILGDSNGIEVGDKVIAIGYPGPTISGENIRLSPETNLVPTVTSGIISAIRKLPDGSNVIQTDVTIFHGNSGGPAFDESGRVIGVTTFGSGQTLSSGEWLDIQGYNFLIPINVAKSFISELNINTTTSEATVRFEKGLEYYWNKQYSEAEKEFNRIVALDPNNKYASDYAKMSMSHAR